MTAEQQLKTVGKYPLNISGEEAIQADIVSIPLNYLKLDPNNVRFKHIPTPLSDKEIEEHILLESDTKSLLREIKFSRGLSEAPFVKKLSDLEYLVIEGNRRTVCMRTLVGEISSGKEKDIPRERIDPIDCILLPENMKSADIALLLTRIHVSGKKDWPAMDKGAHVYDLIEIHGMDYDDVAKAVHISKNTISQNVKAYKQTLLYHEKFPEDESWLQRFSHFLELYKKRGLKEWVEVPDNMKEFMQWINKGQIPMAIQVRKLDKIILEDKEAYKAMTKGGTIEHALEIFAQNESVKKTDEGSDTQMKNWLVMIKSFPRDKMQELAKDRAKLEEYEEAHREFGKLLKDVKALG
ncbi:hypothetical protein HX827_01675 [Marine Group I thaumarchaeote]|uniref:ParB N-terminal domain-containing protein n=1 Tax=Marine Group I thaumarchaeote TaxID=2511932 RepID=A0A7K4NSL9_9ARCH|nr:hypothetical protein [Marine Group I thaumarchaeote]